MRAAQLWRTRDHPNIFEHPPENGVYSHVVQGFGPKFVLKRKSAWNGKRHLLLILPLMLDFIACFI
jgi:hypothetical protein